jgi:hypothetical protein
MSRRCADGQMARRRVPVHGEHQAEIGPDVGQSHSVTMNPLGMDRVTLPAPSDEALGVVIERLASLLEEEDTDEYGVLRPTEYAFTTTWNLLVAAAQDLAFPFPRAAVSTDSEGGIRVQWLRPERQVRMVIPSVEGKPQYIYHEERDDYDVESTVSARTLAGWLTWLVEHE